MHRSSTRSSVWKTESPTMKRKIGANGHTTLSPVVQPSKSVAPLAKILTETEFYAFAEMVFDLPEVKGLLMAAVNEHNRAEQKEGC